MEIDKMYLDRLAQEITTKCKVNISQKDIYGILLKNIAYVIKEDRIKEALNIAFEYAQIDGGHHKTWVIDRMLRQLLGTEEAYNAWVNNHNHGEDGDDTYTWDTGIAP